MQGLRKGVVGLLMVAGLLLLCTQPLLFGQERDLFAEAGNSVTASKSKWVQIRSWGRIEVALRSDDRITVQSQRDPASALAVEIGAEAEAAACQLEDRRSKVSSYEYQDVNGETHQNVNSSVSYLAVCPFEAGTTERILNAQTIALQVSIGGKKTKIIVLDEKKLARFKDLVMSQQVQKKTARRRDNMIRWTHYPKSDPPTDD